MSPLPPDEQTASGTALRGDLRILRSLLLVGALAVTVIGLLEWQHQQLAPWDRWAYPLLGGACLVNAAVLQWVPRWERHVRRAMVLALDAYLVFAMYMVLLNTVGPPDWYQLVSNFYWMPLAYGSAFVFLPQREALLTSAVMYVVVFAPVFWLLDAGQIDEAQMGLKPVFTNFALAQLVYLVLLLAISRLRSDYLRTRERAEWMQQMAATDPLTGIANRRALNERLVAALSLVARHGQALSVMLLDVDAFKRINDEHGHAAGDAVLVRLADLMSEQLRASDAVGRWGGEEFLLLTPSTPLAAAAELAERIRQAVQDSRFDHGRPVTVSIGVAQAQPGESPEQLMIRADQALYEAKRSGRNQVRQHLAGPPAG